MQRGAASFVGRQTMHRCLALAPLLLSACSTADEPAAPGGVTRDEAMALNDAAAMLDGNSIAANALTPEPKDAR